MPALALAEDHALVERLAASGAVILASPALRVRTSARCEARASGGFSDFLRTLGHAAPADDEADQKNGERATWTPATRSR